MTPCEELGYKVGDLFEVIPENSNSFSKGSIVKLLEDDKSINPLFGLVEGYCSGFDNQGFSTLSKLKPLPKLPTEDFKINLSNMTESEKSLAETWLKDIAEANGWSYANLAPKNFPYIWVQDVLFDTCKGYNSGGVDDCYKNVDLPELSLSFTTPEVKDWELSDKKSEKTLQLEQTIDKLQAALEEAVQQLQSIKKN